MLIVAGIFLFRQASSGPQVQTTESMPASVRQAFMGANKPHATPPPANQ
ncbi:MAG TPA: hypothetical protein VG944_09725 [Fimbriimonas sp.]|nr:hypothetical protein [Fimbriimonas sp.]